MGRGTWAAGRGPWATGRGPWTKPGMPEASYQSGAIHDGIDHEHRAWFARNLREGDVDIVILDRDKQKMGADDQAVLKQYNDGEGCCCRPHLNVLTEPFRQKAVPSLTLSGMA